MLPRPELDRELIENIGNTAYNYEKEYHGCAQCVLKTLQEYLNLGNGDAFKAAHAFAGGIALMGETCGALSGGIMAIGLAFGRERFGDVATPPSTSNQTRRPSSALAAQLYNKVQKEFGSTKCWSIQESIFGRHFDLKIPEEYAQFVAAGGYEKCPEVVKKVAMLAAETILLAQKET